jgi:ribosome-binding protein aMBF1 (putative translation factor)
METQAEKNLREKIKGDWDKLVKEKQGPGQGLSYSDMAKKISDLEKDIYILEA